MLYYNIIRWNLDYNTLLYIYKMKKIDVAIVGAGPAGIGISAMLKDLGVTSQVVLEKNKVGER